MTAVQLERVSRRDGGQVALDNLSLAVPEGSAFALIGPNGSGKSTVLKLIATIVKPTSGTIRVHGHDVVAEAGAVRRLVGYVPDVFGTYPGLKVREYLEYFAGAHRLRNAQATITDLLTLVELQAVAGQYLTTLSRGRKQRLAIARALLHDPSVLLLDEPTFGLDQRGRADVLAVLRELQSMGKTLVISSHLLEDVAQLATDVAAFADGRLVAETSAEELRQSIEGPRRIWVEVANDPRQAQVALAGVDTVRAVEVQGQELRFLYQGSRYGLPEVLDTLVRGEVKVIRFTEESNDLEILLASLGRTS